MRQVSGTSEVAAEMTLLGRNLPGLARGKAPKLGFCITSFNRSHRTVGLVQELLRHSGDDVEIVVSDNCSSDSSVQDLRRIADPRLHVHTNDRNIGAVPNYMFALTLSRAEVLVFSTDKDYADHRGIEQLVEFLDEHREVLCGYCEMNLDVRAEDVIHTAPEAALMHTAYLSRHPTGYFFRRNVLQMLPDRERFSRQETVGNFPFEFMIAELALQGPTAVIKVPLFRSETAQDTARVRSYSYSQQQENLYFTPHQLSLTLDKYLRHLAGLSIRVAARHRVAARLVKASLGGATLGYRRTLRDPNICTHYGLVPRVISWPEVLWQHLLFSARFVWAGVYGNPMTRLSLLLRAHSSIVLQLLGWRVPWGRS